MVGILLSFWEGLFSGARLVLGSVDCAEKPEKTPLFSSFFWFKKSKISKMASTAPRTRTVHLVHYRRRWLGCWADDGEERRVFHADCTCCGQLPVKLCGNATTLQESTILVDAWWHVPGAWSPRTGLPGSRRLWMVAASLPYSRNGKQSCKVGQLWFGTSRSGHRQTVAGECIRCPRYQFHDGSYERRHVPESCGVCLVE